MGSSEDTFSRVGVVGGGIMGTGIAEVCARADLDVVLVEVNDAATDLARERIAHSIDRAVRRGKLEADQAQRALDAVVCTSDFDSLAGCEIVIEAVVESKPAKLSVFERLAQTVGDDTILGSNTSSIPIVDLAVAAGGRSRRVVGMHFFNPVPVMALVEIIPSLLTDDDVTQRARHFVTDQLGKDPIMAPDRAGFTVNALLIPYLLAAIRMFEQGLATAEDIDRGMVQGCAHPMGPLALADLIGLDTVMGVAESLYAEHREQLYAPPPLLQRLVAAGLLGRKTGRGLYSYG
ncbi:MAG TPA: 3-hydroxybutyryl-CoA dehydrogenase [Solirubrobacteraceae bacterium]|nr:3-hydroxybutyryl-CoA dehydrogenase [Solirubrobacteraceae bacterium]